MNIFIGKINWRTELKEENEIKKALKILEAFLIRKFVNT